MHQPPKPSLPGTAKSGASRQRGENQQLMIVVLTNKIKRVDHALMYVSAVSVHVSVYIMLIWLICMCVCLDGWGACFVILCIGVVTSKTLIWYVSILPWEKTCCSSWRLLRWSWLVAGLSRQSMLQLVMFFQPPPLPELDFQQDASFMQWIGPVLPIPTLSRENWRSGIFRRSKKEMPF